MPASTVKPLLAIMGLNEGAITPYYRYFGGATFQIPVPPVSFVTGDAAVMAGWVPAIEVSADTFFYDMAHRVVSTRSTNTTTQFGFGQYSGIDIKEESKGILPPSREWKQNVTVSPGFGEIPFQWHRSGLLDIDLTATRSRAQYSDAAWSHHYATYRVWPSVAAKTAADHACRTGTYCGQR